MKFLFDSFTVDPKSISLTAEEYCLKFACDFYHTLSLSWVHNKRKVTKEYIIYLYRECLDSLLKLMYLERYIMNERIFNNRYRDVVTKLGNDIDGLILGFGVEIQLDESSDLITKIAGLFLVIEKKHGVTWGDIVSYKGTQN